MIQPFPWTLIQGIPSQSIEIAAVPTSLPSPKEETAAFKLLCRLLKGGALPPPHLVNRVRTSQVTVVVASVLGSNFQQKRARGPREPFVCRRVNYSLRHKSEVARRPPALDLVSNFPSHAAAPLGRPDLQN